MQLGWYGDLCVSAAEVIPITGLFWRHGTRDGFQVDKDDSVPSPVPPPDGEFSVASVYPYHATGYEQFCTATLTKNYLSLTRASQALILADKWTVDLYLAGMSELRNVKVYMLNRSARYQPSSISFSMSRMMWNFAVSQGLGRV